MIQSAVAVIAENHMIAFTHLVFRKDFIETLNAILHKENLQDFSNFFWNPTGRFAGPSRTSKTSVSAV